jgi:superkiller protein 3
VIADNNSAVSWSNLGTLYFMLEEYKLANEAFSQAQRSDPNYVNSWIGQALLAETLTHEDAMDLFRHSTQLRIHKQGALGYAHWVCKTLKESPVDAIIYSIHNMHAIPVACDAMTWYTGK